MERAKKRHQDDKRVGSSLAIQDCNSLRLGAASAWELEEVKRVNENGFYIENRIKLSTEFHLGPTLNAPRVVIPCEDRFPRLNHLSLWYPSPPARLSGRKREGMAWEMVDNQMIEEITESGTCSKQTTFVPRYFGWHPQGSSGVPFSWRHRYGEWIRVANEIRGFIYFSPPGHHFGFGN